MITIGITGQNGFIGQHLFNSIGLKKETFTLIDFKNEYFKNEKQLDDFVLKCDVIVHLAAMNRHSDDQVIYNTNIQLVDNLVASLERTNSKSHVIMSSSLQEEKDNLYGKSKKDGRKLFLKWESNSNGIFSGLIIPNVFGPFGRPNYNSVVATFCHNVANGLSLQVDDAQKVLKLVHIDDVAASLVSQITSCSSGLNFPEVRPEFEITVGALAEQIKSFQTSRTSLELGYVGEGLGRALYSTYISYLPKEKFSYDIPMHIDNRGTFVEFFKNKKVGQFSFLTVRPGFTRGSHYHHTKTEKFLVIFGTARFNFRNISTCLLYTSPSPRD